MVDFDNYCIDRKSPTQPELLMYMEEVNGCCPICGKPLTLEKNGRAKKLCEIAHVFPNRPTEYEKSVLKDVRLAGDNSESTLNKIALCKDCHDEYDELKTVDSYNNMFELKARLRLELDSKKMMANFSMEDELGAIVLRLAHLTPEDFKLLTKLEMNALTVDQKVEDDFVLLRNKIEQDVVQYYLFIRSKFKELGDDALSFDTIAYNVKLAYCKLRDKKLNKPQIYDQMVMWFENQTHCRKEACEKMVAFFIQNCEIYEKLSE